MTKKINVAQAASVKRDNVTVDQAGLRRIPKRSASKEVESTQLQAVKRPVRENSKQARLIEMLRQVSGTTIQQIMDMTGWQQHSVRGFLSGTIKKKLGLTLISNKDKNNVRTYRVETA